MTKGNYFTMEFRKTSVLVLLSAVTVLALLLQYQGVSAFTVFRSRIPNGFNVPNPCRPGQLWHGVGHKASGGGGPRNQFGKDFANASYLWTDWLCMEDSDGDGSSNGAELGDPACAWTIGDTPSTTTNITHPGIHNTNPSC